MSNQTNNNNLKDFLKKSKTESFDDFEKDALEGFQSLESEHDALELKSQVDKRIYAEVFSEKKSTPKIYWFAAAGLVLVVGLSIFFILNNESSTLKKDMAFLQQAETKNLESKVEEETANEKTIDKQDAVPKEQKQISNITTSGGKALRQDVSTASGKNAVSGPENNYDKDVAHSEQAAAKKPVDLSNDDKAAKDEIAVDDFENDKKGEAEKKPSLGKFAREKIALEEVSTNVPAGNADLKKESETKSKSKRKKEDSKSLGNTKSENESVPDANGNEGYADSRASTSKEDNLAKNNKSTSPASPSSAPIVKGGLTNNSNCYYTGGEAALIKDIGEKLRAKKISVKFEATLFINDKKEVEKITFIKPNNLNKDDETHITEVLKSLNKFNFIVNPTIKCLQEYKLVYQP